MPKLTILAFDRVFLLGEFYERDKGDFSLIQYLKQPSEENWPFYLMSKSNPPKQRMQTLTQKSQAFFPVRNSTGYHCCLHTVLLPAMNTSCFHHNCHTGSIFTICRTRVFLNLQSILKIGRVLLEYS